MTEPTDPGVSWIKEIFSQAKQMLEDGTIPNISHETGEFDDGAVTTVLLDDGEHRIQITWGRGAKKNWR
jgi:hypothetical protein